ncbi:MAG: type II toxin-antitoxin system CcdA family antitoxin [Pseudonocardia sp.]
MTKRKVSVTLTPERIARAQEVTGRANLSELLDEALLALVDRELEQRWIARTDVPGDRDTPDDVPVDLSDVPWDPR